jgi:hypothetical protein
MCLLGGLAWLYEKTRKRIQDPRFGTLIYYGESWMGLVPHYEASEPAVRFEVPGTRKGPEEGALERFAELWAGMPQLVESLRGPAIEDLEDAHDALVGTSDEALTRAVIERVAGQPKELSGDWKLACVALRTGLRGGRHWCLDFDVSWDGEHQRTAYLDLDRRLLRYDASCVVVDL